MTSGPRHSVHANTIPRNEWVDIAKGIGIILVVYGHVARGVMKAQPGAGGGVLEIVDTIIYSFHMPLFFFLSGLFFYRSFQERGWTVTIANKAGTVFYPYLVWSVLQGVVEVVLARYTNSNASGADVMSLLWAPRAQFWFLYVLFLVFAIAVSIYPRREARLAIALIMALSVALFACRGMLPDVWVLRSFASSFVFFAAGIVFNEVAGDAPQPRLSGVFALLVLCGALQVFTLVHSLDRHDAWMLVVAFVSIALVIALSMLLARLGVRWLAAMGAASMAIYLMHILAGSGVRIVLAKALGIHSVPLHLIVGTAAGIAIPLLANALIKRLGWEFLYAAPLPSRRASAS